jgi:hypothetical protein
MSSSPNPSVMICRRTRRTRSTSTCASAIRSAAARRASPAPGEAIRSANVATSGASAGSASTGRLSPWRSALRATAALPAAVRGPVLRAAFARLAARILSLTHGLAGKPVSTRGAKFRGQVSPKASLVAMLMPVIFDDRVTSLCHCHTPILGACLASRVAAAARMRRSPFARVCALFY